MWVFGYGSLVWKVDFKYESTIVGYIKGYHRRFYQHSIDHRGIPEKPGRVVTLVQSSDPDSAVWGVAYKIRAEDMDQVSQHLDFREKNGYKKKVVTFHPRDSTHDPFELTLYVASEENESYAVLPHRPRRPDVYRYRVVLFYNVRSFDTERFIVEVESRKGLWDISCDDYSNKDVKRQLWLELTNILGSETLENKEKAELGPASIEEIAKQVVSCSGPSGPNKEYVYNLATAMRLIAPGITDEHLDALEKAVKSVDPEL